MECHLLLLNPKKVHALLQCTSILKVIVLLQNRCAVLQKVFNLHRSVCCIITKNMCTFSKVQLIL